MNRDEKAAVVDEIAEQIKSSDAIFAVDYRGISVQQAADLRVRLRETGTRFRIVKNSLTERAADQAGAEGLKALLAGPTALAFVTGDAAQAAKALNDAARVMHNVRVQGRPDGLEHAERRRGSGDRRACPAREVLHCAARRDDCRADHRPGARGLNALIVGLAIQLQAIADLDPPALVRGEAPAPAPAAEPEAEAPAPEPEAEVKEPIVDVEAEPGLTLEPEETDQEAAPDEESGA